MGHGRKLRRGYVEDETPELTSGQRIGKVTELRDKGIVAVVVPGDTQLEPSLAYLPPRFRSVLFLRRGTGICWKSLVLGSYLVLSPIEEVDDEQKVQWTIETLLRNDDIKQLRKDGNWPVIFDPLVNVRDEEDDDEEEEEEEEEGEDQDQEQELYNHKL